MHYFSSTSRVGAYLIDARSFADPNRRSALAQTPSDSKSRTGAQTHGIGPKTKNGRFVKVADNLYRRSTSPYFYIMWRQGRRRYFKSTYVSSLKEAKRLRNEFLVRIRTSTQTRDERLSYPDLRQLYIDHCKLLDLRASLEVFLDTRAKHLDAYFSDLRAVDIIQSGSIGHYITMRKSQGASHASINREVRVLAQMFRLAASDQHRMLSPGFVPAIRKLRESPPRQAIITEKQYTEIRRHLPEWARPVISALNITGWRVSAILSRCKTDLDLERGFLILDGESSKNGYVYRWPLIGQLGMVVRTQLSRINSEERRTGRVIPWLFHRGGKRIPYYTLYENWRKATAAAGCPDKLMHDFRRTAATRIDSTPGISESVALSLLGLKTSATLRHYIQRNDERLIEAAKLLSGKRSVRSYV